MKNTKKILERDILSDICQYLKSRNAFFWRSNNIPVFGRNNAGKMTFRSMPKFSMKGIPDVIIIKDGQFIGIEVKAPTGKMRPEQLSFEILCVANGGEYYTVRSLDELKIALFKYNI